MTQGEGLHLHVRLEDRDNLNEYAMQGELFGVDDAESDARGYRGSIASKVAGGVSLPRLPVSPTVNLIIGRVSRSSLHRSLRRMVPGRAVCTHSRMW